MKTARYFQYGDASVLRIDDVDALGSLRRRVSGAVLTAADAEYDDARAGFQTARSHSPAVLVAAASVDDIRQAVEFAKEQGLPVGVQGTGHALAATAQTGGVLVATRGMAGVGIDAHTRTARVQAGAEWTAVIAQAARAGLAPLSGWAPHVGAVSYTLGGGIGPLSRRYGYAADHVRAVNVVTADARNLTVTADIEPELFWAVRGARDNFGIASWIDIDLMPVTRLYGGGLFFPPKLTATALEAYREWAATVPDEVTSSLALISFPDVGAVPEPLRGRRIVQLRIAVMAETGRDNRILADGERLVAPLRSIGPALIDTLGPMPFTEIYNEPAVPAGPSHSSTALLRTIDAAAIRTFADAAEGTLPHVIELRPLGGALAREPEPGNAIGHRDAAWLLVLASRLDRGVPLQDIQHAHDDLLATLSPWTRGGRMLNFLIGHGDAALVREAYDPDDWAKLTALKAHWDRGNTFRLNHNIPPALGVASADMRVDEP